MYLQHLKDLKEMIKKINMVTPLQQRSDVTVAGSFNDNFIAVTNNNQ